MANPVLLTNTDSFLILSDFENTKAFLNCVREAADAHRNEFGFLPASVYEEFARNGRLYVLVEHVAQGLQYAGHLLFNQRYPSARVVQMFTHPRYRRQGLASRLINHFRDELTRFGFSSVYASVAEDLIEANLFWERHLFHIQTVKRGGETRKRKILRRCHELDSPQLFPSSGIGKDNPLGLASASSAAIPFLLVDLNVLFDVTGPRRVRHADAVGLFQAERMNLCKLAISSEIREELHRTAAPGKLDPMEGFIDILPAFPLKKFDPKDAIFQRLVAIAFPGKEVLTPNDKSDMCHVVTAIQYGLAGLITNDQTVLEAGPKIKTEYGVEIISPASFLLDEQASQDGAFEGFNNTSLALCALEGAQFEAVYSFLSRQGVTVSAIATEWLPTGANSRAAPRFAVWANEELVGYMTWAIVANSATIIARVAVNGTDEISADAARIMLTYLLEKLPQQGPMRVNLETPSQQSSVREIANSLGFRGRTGQEELYKIILGGVLTTETWKGFQRQLSKNSSIKLPEYMPSYQHQRQQIELIAPDGNRRFLALDELESLLSPVLFCLPDRPAVITPIQRCYAEHLLGSSPQESLLPSSRASLFQNRHYLSANRTLKYFKPGTLILFYESSKGGGCCAIVAIARVCQAYHKQIEDFGADDFEQSVLTRANMGAIGTTKTKTVTVFDNIFVLPHPVPLATLRRLECGTENQLISTNPISAAQLQGILHEAFGHG